MKTWMKISICSLIALLLGFVGGFAIHYILPPRSTAVITSQLTSSVPASSDSASEGSTFSLLHCALDTLGAIEQQDYTALATYVHPELGVTFTPSATVDPTSNLTFLPDELTSAASSSTSYVWGTSSSTSTPIKLTLTDYFASYVWDRDYTASPRISVDTPQVSGNALENTLQAYPDGHYVEFYCPAASGQTEWSTLRLVYQWYNNQWYLVGIIHSAWNL